MPEIAEATAPIYLDTMDELLELVVCFAEQARDASDPVRLGVCLKLMSVTLRNALEIYTNKELH